MEDLIRTETPVDLYEFTKEQKIKLMQFAMADKDYFERTNQVQKEMDNLRDKL